MNNTEKQRKSRWVILVCVIVAVIVAFFALFWDKIFPESKVEAIPDEDRIPIVYAADFEFAPFRVSTDEGYFGYEIDVNYAIFANTKYKLEYRFENLAIDNLEELAKSEEIAIFGWRVITPVTQQYMLMSDPVFEFQWGAVTRQDIGTLTPEDYKNYRIGIVHKKYPYNYLVMQMGLENVVIFDKYEEAATALAAGEIDIWFEEREISNYYTIKSKVYATTIFHDETVIPLEVGLLIRPDLVDLQREINEQIRIIKETNQLESFHLRHFQKHSSEYLRNQEIANRNIVIYSGLAVLVFTAITLGVIRLYRRNLALSRTLSSANQSLEMAKEQFSTAVSGANDGILYYSSKTDSIILSEMFCQILAVPHKESFTWEELEEILLNAVHARHHSRLQKFLAMQQQKTEGLFSQELRATMPGASWIMLRVTFAKQLDHWVVGGTLSDITKRKEIEERTLFYAEHDFLTGTYNRMYLLRSAKELIASCENTGKKFSLLYIDLDNFKTINDTYGHDYGDDALKQVVAAIEKNLTPQDLLGRVGGDEFVVLLPESSDVEAVCGAICRDVAGLAIKDISIGASIGVAAYPKDGILIDALIVDADTASRQAKERGKNQWVYYEPGMGAREG